MMMYETRSCFIVEPKYFSGVTLSKHNEISFIEVSLSDKDSILAFSEFYTEVYLECFPNENERESFDNLIKYMKEAASNVEYNNHIVLAIQDGRVIAGGIFDYFNYSNCGIIEYIAVHPKFQSLGIGSLLYQRILSELKEDSYQNNQQLFYIFCEVEFVHPNKEAFGKQSIPKNLSFWNKQGFHKLDFDYIQPALSFGQAPVHILDLCVCNLTDMSDIIQKELVFSVLQDYMLNAMSIQKPKQHPIYLQMVDSLKFESNIKLLPIVP